MALSFSRVQLCRLKNKLSSDVHFRKQTPNFFSFTKQKKRGNTFKVVMNSEGNKYYNSCPLYVNDKDSLYEVLECMNANSMNYYSYTTLHLLSYELEKAVKENNKTINSWVIDDIKGLDSLYYAFLLKTAYYGIILKVLFAIQMKKSILICPSPLLPQSAIIKLCKFLSEQSLTLGAPSRCICWIDDPKPDVLKCLDDYKNEKNLIIHCL